jgi:putative salt-induced outer membrane protein
MKHILVASLVLASGSTWAQASVKDDGQWRAALGAAFSNSSGNTKSTSLSLLGDAVRATKQDKWALYGSALYGESAGTKTADQLRLGTKYDWNLSPTTYAFGTLEAERDAIAGLDSRLTAGAGMGWRIVNTDTLKFEVFGGAAYVSDQYKTARLIDGASRKSYGYPSLLLGEESSHKLGESTTAKQRLVIYPNLKNSGEYRAQWDAGLSVAMSKSMNLTTGLAVRVNSDPGPGLKKTDTLFTTGISIKFE